MNSSYQLIMKSEKQEAATYLFKTGLNICRVSDQNVYVI